MNSFIVFNTRRDFTNEFDLNEATKISENLTGAIFRCKHKSDGKEYIIKYNFAQVI